MPDLDPKGIEAAQLAIWDGKPGGMPADQLVERIVAAYLDAVPMVPKDFADRCWDFVISEWGGVSYTRDSTTGIGALFAEADRLGVEGTDDDGPEPVHPLHSSEDSQ